MKSEVKTLIRVGRISYVNAVPFYHRLKGNDSIDLEFLADCPARINQAMHEGKVDIAPVSSLEYLNHQKNYMILPDLVIGARDFSGSVLLLSKEKIEGLDGAKIALTSQSLSSAVLLKVLLRFKFKFENQFETASGTPDELLAGRRAALVIGDDALLYHPKEFVYKYDLSELWWNWTAKPFCFALWVVHKEFARKHPEEVVLFYQQLKENLHRNLTDIETLMKESLQLNFLDTNFPKIFGYLFNLSYGFDQAMQEGLELYYRLAHQLEVSPQPEKLEFFKL